MPIDVPVYRESQAAFKRGNNCPEMGVCRKCRLQKAVFVRETNKAETIGFTVSGERFDRIIWEQWKCVSCGNSWVEKYGVRNGG